MALSLAINGLDAGYGAVKALRGVTLNVEAGETVALLGTNGNGTSTLMKCIAGLVRPEGDGSHVVRAEDGADGCPDGGGEHGLAFPGLRQYPPAPRRALAFWASCAELIGDAPPDDFAQPAFERTESRLSLELIDVLGDLRGCFQFPSRLRHRDRSGVLALNSPFCPRRSAGSTASESITSQIGER